MARISQEAKLKARKIKHCLEEEVAVRNQLKYLKHNLKQSNACYITANYINEIVNWIGD